MFISGDGETGDVSSSHGTAYFDRCWFGGQMQVCIRGKLQM